MNRKKIVWGIAVVTGLAGAGIWGWSRWQENEMSRAASGVDTHTVGEGIVEVALKETGVVQPRQTVAVKSKVSGKIRSVLVAEGEQVRAGQLVAVVEPDASAMLTLSQKRLDLRRLKVDLDQKDRDWKRQKRLLAEGLVSSQIAEESERDAKTAQNYFIQAKTALNLLEREANQPATSDGEGVDSDPAALTDYRILAPIEGIVATVKVKPGELAMSGTTGFSQEGALLLEIADQRELEVIVNINEIDVPKLHPGMTAKITLAARPGQPIGGTVARVAVAPITDTNKLVVYPVAIHLSVRPPELRQGMTATVDLTLETIPKTLRIPILAYGEKDAKSWVKIRSARPQKPFDDREVTIGLKGDKFVEVKSGLASKDVILSRYPKDGGEKSGKN